MGFRACMLSRFSRVRLFETPWAIARQGPLSMVFSRQEDWSGLLCSPPRDLPEPGIELASADLLFNQISFRQWVSSPFYRWLS